MRAAVGQARGEVPAYDEVGSGAGAHLLVRDAFDRCGVRVVVEVEPGAVQAYGHVRERGQQVGLVQGVALLDAQDPQAASGIAEMFSTSVTVPMSSSTGTGSSAGSSAAQQREGGRSGGVHETTNQVGGRAGGSAPAGGVGAGHDSPLEDSTGGTGDAAVPRPTHLRM